MSGSELATEFLYFVLVIHRDTMFIWMGVFQERYKLARQENTYTSRGSAHPKAKAGIPSPEECPLQKAVDLSNDLSTRNLHVSGKL
jgi:hypothetical protein